MYLAHFYEFLFHRPKKKQENIQVTQICMYRVSTLYKSIILACVISCVVEFCALKKAFTKAYIWDTM